MKMRCIFILLMVLAVGLPFCEAVAEERIKAIEVVGGSRVDYQTVCLYTKVKIGDEIGDDGISQIIKNLYATNLFSHINVDVNRGVLVVRIKENPVINDIKIKGNKIFSDKELKDNIIRTQPLSIFSKTKLHSDLVGLVALYRNSGRLGFKVNAEIVELERNRVDIVFRMQEGPIAKVRKINFIGNTVFSDKQLLNVINSRKYSFDKVLSKSARYIPDQIMLDKALLTRFYSTKGYMDFTVKSFVAEISDDFGSVYLSFSLEEGAQKKFGSSVVSLEESDDGLQKDLTAMLPNFENQAFNMEKVNDLVEKITAYLSDKGNLFSKVEPDYEVKGGKVDVKYRVLTGNKVYVNRINIVGNSRTLDKVISREVQITEGDAYSTTAIRQSRRSVRNLGFFDAVDVETDRLKDDLVDLNLVVKERSTGTVKFSAGLSSGSGLMGDIEVKERNLMGTGRELSANLEKSAISFLSSIDLTEPRFLDSDVSLGAGLFYSSQEQQKNGSFSSVNSGFITRLSYEITENLLHSIRYSYKYTNIDNVKDNASIFIKEQAGKNTDSSIGHTLSYNRLDSLFRPKNGYLIKLSQDLSGVGGTLHYVKSDASAIYFQQVLKNLSDNIVLRFRVNSGYVFGYDGEQAKIGQRFFIGMNEVRGFDLAGIGPRDAKTGDPLGGKFYFTQTAQVDFPVGLPQDIDIKGSLFVDCGTLFGLDYEDKKGILESHMLRVSVGFGFSWSSPLGPMRLDFGFPINKEPYDRDRIIKFSIDTGF